MLRVRKQVYCVDTFSGRGITAAVLDTGISRHPDFGKRIVGFQDFVAASPEFMMTTDMGRMYAVSFRATVFFRAADTGGSHRSAALLSVRS